MGVLDDDNYDYNFNEVMLSTQDFINDECLTYIGKEEKVLNP
jgi:hypothetical protein